MTSQLSGCLAEIRARLPLGLDRLHCNAKTSGSRTFQATGLPDRPGDRDPALRRLRSRFKLRRWLELVTSPSRQREVCWIAFPARAVIDLESRGSRAYGLRGHKSFYQQLQSGGLTNGRVHNGS